MQNEKITILVVDDHPNTAATLARALHQLGDHVDVMSATSGHDALEKVKNKGVNILITDMIMPEMTGLELIEKLQNHPGGKPSYTYLITAYDVPGLKVTAQRLKVNEVIVKPVRPERIYQIASRAIGEMRHASKPEGSPQGGKRKFKILVADDRPDNVTLLTRYLDYEGYDQVVAQDGVETLEKVRDELPDLVLLDVDMPRKDGFTVLEEVRADPSTSHIPVIILTAARLDPMDVQSGLNLGADDYVTKPFERHELMARIRTKLRVKEAEDVIRRRNRELNLLPEIGKELSARLDIRDLANVLLKRTVETLGAIQGNMIVLGSNGQVEENFEATITAGVSVKNEGQLPNGLLRRVRETQQGLIIPETQNDPDWTDNTNTAIRSAIVVPLYGRRDLLGLLMLAHEQEKYFTLEHLLLLQAIASQAAIAIENARLYARVAQEQKRLDAVLQNAAEAVLLFDEEGRLQLINPVGQRLFTGFDARVGEKLERGHGYGAFINLIEKSLTSHTPTSEELVWPDKRTFMIASTPIETGGAVCVLHDVTQFKNLDQVKNEFIATTSHDLKNPLTSITGFSQMLAMAGPLNDQQKEFVQRIQHATHTMTELVMNMLELASLDLDPMPKKEVIDMHSFLSSLTNEFKPQADEKQQTLEFKPSDEHATIQGTPLQVKQLFRNLIGNAIKYTQVNGHITITEKQVDDQIQVDVQDNGYGIPEEDLPFIFERFYRVRSGKNLDESGNGLGLAIVKTIVERHGGHINVKSEVDKGTCFSIFLPVSMQN